ncbi:meiotic 218 isoform X2 [Tachypleus tridentatus]|uniref:meiotic 218 isoform X2 n=1 Tax=Tachypleus tridentatus TaxID=6853 RepID=UPI003FD38ED9
MLTLQSARYQCPLEDCEGYQGNKFVRVHIPGAWETETIRKDFLCLYCKSPLVEDPTWRILGDKVIAQVIPSDPLCTSAHSVRHQSITVYCRDELIKNILLGRKYSVIGILVTRKIESSIFILMEANSMKLIENVPHNVQSSIHNLPPPVVELYHDRLCSPWSFGLNLAYVFADKVSPPGTFYQFKLGLLLSIINSTNSTILARSKSVLAVGSDTLTLQRLFLYAGTFGHHCIHHTSLNFLMGQVYKDLLHSSVLWFVEAGTLLLATDGVCFLGDLSFTSKNNQEILGRALDSGNIIITPPPQVNCVSDLPLLKYPLQCTVWGLISSNSRKKGDSGRKQMEQTSAGLENLDKILIDGFGMIYITDSTVPSGDDYYNQLTICQISVKSSALSSSNISMSNEEWKKFLTYASSLDTRFTEEAEFLIQGYYIASRRVHASVAHGPEFPMAAVSTLMSVAHAFSKLSLRQRVTDSDAVMAILLYEETLSARYGYSTLNVRNMPHARNKDISYLFGVENDQRLHQFHKLLQQFIATYAGDVGLKEE